MSYEDFKEHVCNLVEKAGGEIYVVFYADTDSGKYYANCSDGTVLIGEENRLSVTVLWNGKAHCAVAKI